MEDILFVAFPVILIVICVICFVISGIKNRKRNKTHTVQAQVISKKIKRANVHRLARAGVSGMDWMEYYAIFSYGKNKTVELQLPVEIYNRLEKGDKGQLSFKGYYFISFDKNSCFFV